jgi:hypothetical protein
MQIEFSLSKRLLLPALSLALLGFFTSSAGAQDVERIGVTGDDVTSAYGAPGGFSRARFRRPPALMSSRLGRFILGQSIKATPSVTISPTISSPRK